MEKYNNLFVYYINKQWVFNDRWDEMGNAVRVNAELYNLKEAYNKAIKVIQEQKNLTHESNF